MTITKMACTMKGMRALLVIVYPVLCCQGDTSTGLGEGEVAIVEPVPDRLEVMEGEAAGISVIVRNGDRDEVTGLPIVWTSLNPNVARVDQEGEVVGVTPGTTQIVAEVAGVRGFVDVRVTAKPRFPLTVTGDGTGSGTVTTALLNIDCTIEAGLETGSCSEDFKDGSQVVLLATPSNDSAFVGWGGNVDCGELSSCTVSIDEPKNVIANFQARIDIRKTSPPIAFSDTTAQFLIEISNPSDEPLVNVTVIDTLDPLFDQKIALSDLEINTREFPDAVVEIIPTTLTSGDSIAVKVMLRDLAPTDGFVRLLGVQVRVPQEPGFFCNRATASGENRIGRLFTAVDEACVNRQ